MTEITNPAPGDPSGPSAPLASPSPVDGSDQLVDGGSTGTDDGPGGIPAALTGVDRDGDEVAPPPAALPGDAGSGTGVAAEGDPLSPADTSSPLTGSSSRGETAQSSEPPAARPGR